MYSYFLFPSDIPTKNPACTTFYPNLLHTLSVSSFMIRSLTKTTFDSEISTHVRVQNASKHKRTGTQSYETGKLLACWLTIHMKIT